MNEENLVLVKNILEKNITNAEVKISDMTGTFDHLEIIVSSPVFANKTLIQQHKIVMDLLKNALQGPVHAVKIKTIATRSTP